MNVSKKEKKAFVMKERLLKFKTLNGLFNVLLNLCNLLMADKHYDNCYCNVVYKQCELCNFANYVRYNKIKDELLRNKQCEDYLFDIAYRLLFYIKRIKNDHKLCFDDRKWVLDFFKRKFD